VIARPRRAALLVGLATLVVCLPLAPARMSTAFFTDSDPTTASLLTMTLDPPTGLSGSAVGLLATLDWTASVDAAVATGYQVWRGTASGGPYTQVGTRTPATATSTTNTVPATGRYYYVLRTYAFAAPWISLDSNEAVVSTPVNTGLLSCAANAAVPNPGNGDGNGYQTAPAEACDTDGTDAIDTNSGDSGVNSCSDPGKDRHDYWNFTLGVPLTALAIDGIEVRGIWETDANGGSPSVCVRLSWDGGATWTGYDQQAIDNDPDPWILGGSADSWGRTWAAAELSNANFRVQVVNVATNNNRDFRLDSLQVRVTYRP
jgi:hypothetical protein